MFAMFLSFSLVIENKKFCNPITVKLMGIKANFKSLMDTKMPNGGSIPNITEAILFLIRICHSTRKLESSFNQNIKDIKSGTSKVLFFYIGSTT